MLDITIFFVCKMKFTCERSNRIQLCNSNIRLQRILKFAKIQKAYLGNRAETHFKCVQIATDVTNFM